MCFPCKTCKKGSYLFTHILKYNKNAFYFKKVKSINNKSELGKYLQLGENHLSHFDKLDLKV